jgi:hypothetical protein
MMTKLFGIISRAYYVLIALLSVIFFATAWDKYEYSQMQFGAQESLQVLAWQQTATEQAPIFLLLGVFIIPAALLFKRVVKWVAFGQ